MLRETLYYRKPFRKPCITGNPYHRKPRISRYLVLQETLYYGKPCITGNPLYHGKSFIKGNSVLQETLYYRNPVLQEPLYYRDLFLIQLILGSLSFVGNCSQSQPKELRIGNPNL